ncbi:MAG: hypothetical protein IKA30_02125 [Alphaproteobacteria bacterium]|nr:hypothetical protein [Alphaproteobacteria bacterium]
MSYIFEKVISFFEWLMMGTRKESEKVDLVLKNIDKSDIKKREPDKWDKEFIKLVPVFHLYRDALDFLNRYGCVCDTYFEELSKHSMNKDLTLQRCFCRVSRNKYTCQHICKYPMLLFNYLRCWDLSPSVKEEIKRSPEYYEDVISLYNKLAPEFNRAQI